MTTAIKAPLDLEDDRRRVRAVEYLSRELARNIGQEMPTIYALVTKRSRTDSCRVSARFFMVASNGKIEDITATIARVTRRKYSATPSEWLITTHADNLSEIVRELSQELFQSERLKYAKL